MSSIYIRDGRAPIPKDERVSRIMSAIRAKDTAPELLVRRMLLSVGIRGYRLHPKQIPGRPDIVFSRKRAAIFIHGCFWHGCSYCKPKLPKTHRVFWKKKILANQLRDVRKIKDLKNSGWQCFIIWACRLRTERGRDWILRRIYRAVE